MFVFGRADLSGIENETLDFSQLEDYINDDNENNIYFQEALVSSDLKLSSEPVKEQLYVVGSNRSQTIGTTTDASSALTSQLRTESQLPHGIGSNSGASLGRSVSFRHRNGGGAISSPNFTKPHHLPDSPPDSGSEPPFSPPHEDPKLSCASRTSIDVLQQSSQNGIEVPPSGKRYAHQQALHNNNKHAAAHDAGGLNSSTSPLHLQHHLHHHLHHHNTSLSNVALQSSHSTSLPLLTISSINPQGAPLLNHLSQTVLPSVIANNLQNTHAMMTPPSGHLEHLYSNGEEMLYENVSSPTVGSTFKKRKVSDTSKTSRSGINEAVHIKTEPATTPVALEQGGSILTASSDEDYTLDATLNDRGSPFADATYQCIRFQPFQQSTWAQLLDRDMNDMTPPHFRVDADKGFNYSNADESFVCQKKNHFQVTVHVQNSSATSKPCYIRTPEGTMAIDKFALHFHGVKMESVTQMIKVEQSQSDRSKKPFKPVPVELLPDQVTKTTVGRLHFSETTSNNMRKKGKPNPDQRFFFLVVSLCAHVSTGDNEDTTYPVVAHSSEKIIVRASNPGQFENDMELSWQKGTTPESIFHGGRVGINTDRPEESLVVHGNIKVTGHIVQPSDARAKVDIQELDTKEQLKNVASLRIVRYRYLPEFAKQVGLDQGTTDTGVIAQEVRTVLPEAVMEAGDVLLQDEKLVKNLLVVNKERIFMENVGAVKELCKVTDNLENRIDELEKINKKLTSIKRKDSLKSTSTVASRAGTPKTRKRSHYSASRKCNLSYQVNSCSSRFVQSTIVALVLIMAFCLVALATLYIMEWQNRHWIISYIPHPSVITVNSFPVATSEIELSPMDRASTAIITNGATSPLATLLFPGYSKATTTSAGRNSLSPGAAVVPITTTTTTASQYRPHGQSHTKVPDELVFGLPSPGECVDDCRVYCCSGSNLESLDREVTLVSGSHRHPPHVDAKRGGTTILSSVMKANNLEHNDVDENLTLNEKLTDTDKGWTASKPLEQKEGRDAEILTNYNFLQRKRIRKRTFSARDSQKTDVEKGASFLTGILLEELNTTLTLKWCKQELDDSYKVRWTCNLFLSRHFSLSNVTIRFSSENELISDLCTTGEFFSCPETADINAVTRDLPAQNNGKSQMMSSWTLPVGSYFKSSYKFRTVSRSMFPDGQQVCNLPEGYHQVTEFTLVFQRMCDK